MTWIDCGICSIGVAVFVDGDFWHGWRFPTWRLKLSEKWEEKIAANRRRDARNHAKLRRCGWTVVRIWEHQMERDPGACLRRVLIAVNASEMYTQDVEDYRDDIVDGDWTAAPATRRSRPRRRRRSRPGRSTG